MLQKLYLGWRYFRPEVRQNLVLSYPIILAQLGIVLMGVIDHIMVGDLGAAPLAAIGIANAVFFTILVFTIGTLSIVSPLVSATKTQQQLQTCSVLLSATLQLSILFGLINTLVFLLLSLNFSIFEQPAPVTKLAAEYLWIVAFSALPLTLFLGLKGFTDGLSVSKPAMYATFIGLALNVFLNWLLIYGNLGAPALGLAGAAYATLGVRVAMVLSLWLYLFFSSRLKRYYQWQDWLKFSPLQWRKVLALGVPAGMQYIFEAGAFGMAAMLAGWLGTYQLAAHQIGISLASVTYMVATGLAIAGSIRVGKFRGEQNVAGILKSGTTAFLLVTLFMTLTCLGFIFAKQFLVNIYVEEVEVMDFALALVVIAAFFQLSDGIQAVALGALRGLEDVRIPTLLTLFAYWGVGIPSAYYFAFVLNFNIIGVWYGLLIGLTVSALLLTLRFYSLAARRDISPKKQASIEAL